VPPQYGGPGGAAGRPPKRRRGILIAAIVGGLLLVAIAVLAFLYLAQNDGRTGSPSTPGGRTALPDPTAPPTGLGDDPALDELARDCYDGDMPSCDDLFDLSQLDSNSEAYGDTCAGRQPLGGADYCTVTFPQ
jgi:hypothetical protein